MSATFRFDGKRVLVTGAGKGIGRGIAKKLAECGAEVLALSRTQADLDSLAVEVPGIQPVCVDLADWGATKADVEELGPIHLLVNNASILLPQPFFEVTQDALERTYAVNVNAMINVSQVVARGMIERGKGGSIVIMSGLASHVILPATTALATSKAAEITLAKVMAKELGPHQIRVNAIQPTVVLTSMGKAFWDVYTERDALLARHPLGHLAEIADVVDATLYLLSDQSAMITGTCLPIDGGVLAN